ncbi:MAG TPA: tetratricopeptide repeat protein, partial [Thermoanaerobaculia bacterium]
DVESRIQDLKKRVEREPGSRFFVPLAEEYRKAGRLSQAIGALEDGLIAHPGYVAARVALARAYLEVGRVDESMTAFSKALADDPSNLVAAKALGDLHLSRGESIEALKRYLRYRGISGDRRVDALIARLQEETAPVTARSPEADAPPPPPAFPLAPIEPLSLDNVPAALAEPFVPPGYGPVSRAARGTDPHDISGVEYESPDGLAPAAAEQPTAVPSRDRPLDSIASPRKGDEEIVTRKIRLPEANWPFEAPTPPPPPLAENPPSPQTEGRTLADLYLEQGHYAEARELYAALLAESPGDGELRSLRDEAAHRADVAPRPDLPDADPARERRLAKIRILNEWLATVQARAETGNR